MINKTNMEQLEKDLRFSELENTLIGTKLGDGHSREVYNVEYDKTKVIKIAKDINGKHGNIMEFNIYQQVSYTKYAKWFAPVHYVSACGTYLIMDKADTNRNVDKYPKKVPHFFHDMKYTNYGFIGKQFVIFDYAFINIADGIKGKMKNAKWWDQE